MSPWLPIFFIFFTGVLLMAQIIVPVSDQATGSWTTTPLWSKVNDNSVDNPTGDGVFATSETVANNTNTTNLDLELDTAGSDPEVSTGHILRARWSKTQASNRTMDAHLELWQGIPDTGTQIASLDITSLEESEVEDTYTLTGTEADNITDYGDLYLRVWGRATAGGPSRSLVVDLVELQTPTGQITGAVTGDIALGDAVALALSTALSDSIDLGDAIAPIDVDTLVTDSIDLGDAVGVLLALQGVPSDGIDLGDAVTPSIGVSESEGIDLGDVANLDQQESVLDGIDLGDVVEASTAVPVQDGIDLGDSLSTALSGAPTDGIDLGDAVTAREDTNRSESDGIALGDAVTPRVATVLSDGIDLGDTLSAQTDFDQAVAEGIDLGDTVATREDANRILLDGIGLGDSLAFLLAVLNTEGIDLGDALGTKVSTPLFEGIDLGDASVGVESGSGPAFHIRVTNFNDIQ